MWVHGSAAPRMNNYFNSFPNAPTDKGSLMFTGPKRLPKGNSGTETTTRTSCDLEHSAQLKHAGDSHRESFGLPKNQELLVGLPCVGT